MGSSTEGPSGTARMRPPPPSLGGSTEGPSGTVRMRPPPPSTALAPCVSPTQHSASWPHGELHGESQWHRPHASATT
eukprot:7386205-Pyramimonas_sp.AAC.1